MPTAIDVARYILDRQGPVTAMKLQKLVYYSQVWSIMWDDDRLFPDAIEAWKNGPVVRALWEATRGRFRVAATDISARANALSSSQRRTVDRVLAAYGDKDAQWLSDLTHLEDPWKLAMARGQNSEISLAEIAEYYSALPPDDAQAVTA